MVLLNALVQTSFGHPDTHATLAKAADTLYDDDVVEEEAWFIWAQLDDSAVHAVRAWTWPTATYMLTWFA